MSKSRLVPEHIDFVIVMVEIAFAYITAILIAYYLRIYYKIIYKIKNV